MVAGTGTGKRFKTFSAQIATMKRNIKKMKGSKKRNSQTKLKEMQALSVAATAACRAAGQTPGTPQPNPIPLELSLDPITRPLTEDDVYYLMERAGYGFNPRKHGNLIQIAQAGGANALAEELLTVRPEVNGFEARLFERLDDNLTPGSTTRTNYSPWGMREALVEYGINTNNPVLVRLADETFFGKWTVNERNLTNGRQYEMFWDYRKVLRRHAMEGGNMRDLLIDISKHPMMLWFLDNGSSTAGSPNENYAREIQELYSMGRDRWSDSCQGKEQNYFESQDGLRQLGDIFQATLALTGWTVLDREIDGQRYYRAVFSESDHRQGPKVMYRGTPWQRTVYRMEDVVDAIMNHPGTAQGLATDLLKAYVTPDPPCVVVLEFARIIRAQNYNFRAAMATLLKSNLFFNRQFKNSVIKSPMHRMAQLFNALGLTYSNGDDLTFNNEMGLNISNLVSKLDAMGMTINSPPTVFYYDQGAWTSQRSFTEHANSVIEFMYDGDRIRRLANTGTSNDPLYYDWWRPGGERLARDVIVDIARRLQVELNAQQIGQVEVFANNARHWDAPHDLYRSMYDNLASEDRLVRMYVIIASMAGFYSA
jgi:hypothetical protein